MEQKNFVLRVKAFVSRHTTLLALIVLTILAICIFPSLFSINVLLDTLKGYSMVGIVSLGMTFVILTGGIDLSVGSIAAVAGFSAAVLTDSFWMLPIFVPIAAGTALGAINGLVITRLKAPPFIATLAMQLCARGTSLIISGEKPLGLKEITESFKQLGNGYSLGIPNLVWIFAIVAVIFIVISKWTRFGRSIYVVGGNEEAARMMGFSPKKIKMWVYTISGLCSGLAGMLLTARLESAQNTAGQGWELTAIAAVVIGGTLLSGGRGRLSGTIYGVMLYGVIEILLGRFSMMVWWINIITGALLLGVVILQSQTESMKGHKHIKKQHTKQVKQLN